MSGSAERAGNDALLIIDVQQTLLDELAPGRRVALLATLAPLLDRARSAGVPVVYVRHDGSPGELIPGTAGWNIASEIAPRAGEPIVEKRSGDAFADTMLSDLLTAFGTRHVIAAGMQTDFCVNATVGGALDRGYSVTLVGDGHATSSSSGQSEEQIREAMHEQARHRGVRIVSAADVFA